MSARASDTSLTNDLEEVRRVARDLPAPTAELLEAFADALEAKDRYREAHLREQLAALTESLTPDIDVPSEAAVVLSQRNAKRRAELLTEFGALTGEQVAEERSSARNRHALAARWRKENRIFGVPYRGQTLYPAFQFDEDGGLRPDIREVLSALPVEEMTEWEVAFWWTAANGWLGDRRPVDMLDGEAAELVEAARHLAEPPAL